MFHQSLDEEKKLKIAELYQTTDLSMNEIADTVKVSLKTAYNYRNYGTEAEIKPNLDESPTVETSTTSSKKDQWECRKCGFITERRLKYCHNCGSGPFDSFYTKVGSPEHVPYVAPQLESETIEPEEEYCDTTRDFWVCQECDHISNTEFDQCPECGCEEIVFAPDGKEPKRGKINSESSNHTDNNPDKSPNGERSIDNNVSETGEPKSGSEDEYEHECGNCGYEFNEILEKCPKCGYTLSMPEKKKSDEYEYECGGCGHEFNEKSTFCPHCGVKFDL